METISIVIHGVVKTMSIDSEVRPVDLSTIDPNISAVWWIESDSEGMIEYKRNSGIPEEPLTSIPAFLQVYIDEWNAYVAPPPPPPIYSLTAARRVKINEINAQAAVNVAETPWDSGGETWGGFVSFAEYHLPRALALHASGAIIPAQTVLIPNADAKWIELTELELKSLGGDFHTLQTVSMLAANVLIDEVDVIFNNGGLTDQQKIDQMTAIVVPAGLGFPGRP